MALFGKKLIGTVLILVTAALTGIGCGRESDEVMPDTNNEQIANPWHDITEEEALAMCEGLFKAPDGAEAVVWRVMDQGEVPLIEMEFTYDDQTYTARVQEALNGDDDITGVYYPMGDDPAILNNWKDAIDNRLMNMDVAQKKEWWNNWLKAYLSNRKECKPIPLLEEENRAIVELLPELESAFEEAAGIICKGTMPKSVDTLFWHTLNENHVANEYPHSMVRVITKVLKNISNIGFERDYLLEIRANLKDIDDDEKKQIDELFLQKGIL